jgi:hypothetical protein
MSFRWGLLCERRPRTRTVDCVFHEVQRDDSMGGAVYCFDARGDAFLAEHVLIRFYRYDCLFDMFCCQGCDDHCLQTLLHRTSSQDLYCLTPLGSRAVFAH